MIIGEKNMDLKRLTGRLNLRFLTEIGRLHWNQGEEVAHFAWFGEPWWYICHSDISPVCLWLYDHVSVHVHVFLCNIQDVIC